MLKRKSGQAIVEYAILLGLIAIAVIIAFSTLGKNIANVFNAVNRTFDTVEVTADLPNQNSSTPSAQMQVEVQEYKLNGEYLLGFFIEEQYESSFDNVHVFLRTATEDVEMFKGNGLTCPPNTYCINNPTNYVVSDLVANGASFVIKSNDDEILSTPVWNW